MAVRADADMSACQQHSRSSHASTSLGSERGCVVYDRLETHRQRGQGESETGRAPAAAPRSRRLSLWTYLLGNVETAICTVPRAGFLSGGACWCWQLQYETDRVFALSVPVFAEFSAKGSTSWSGQTAATLQTLTRLYSFDG